MQSGTITLENSSAISQKVKYTYFTTQWPLLGIYLRGMKIFTHAKTCLQMFIVALLITTPNWKQPNCLFTGEGIKNVVNPYIGILLINKQEQTADICNDMGASQVYDAKSKKAAYAMIPSLWLKKADLQGWQTDQWLRGAGCGGRGLTTKGHQGIFGVPAMSYILIVGVVIDYVHLPKLIELCIKKFEFSCV